MYWLVFVESTIATVGFERGEIGGYRNSFRALLFLGTKFELALLKHSGKNERLCSFIENLKTDDGKKNR